MARAVRAQTEAEKEVTNLKVDMNVVDAFVNEGMLETNNQFLLLTNQGKSFADFVASELFLLNEEV